MSLPPRSRLTPCPPSSPSPPCSPSRRRLAQRWASRLRPPQARPRPPPSSPGLAGPTHQPSKFRWEKNFLKQENSNKTIFFSLGATASSVRLPASKLRRRHEQQPVQHTAGPAASAVHHCSPGPDFADRADRHPVRGCLVTIIQLFLCPVLLPLKQRPVYFLSIKLYLVAMRLILIEQPGQAAIQVKLPNNRHSDSSESD